MGDENDFERATDFEDSEASSYYYEEEAPQVEKKQKGTDSDLSEDEGFYMPTVLQKSKTTSPATKKVAKKKKKTSGKSNKRQSSNSRVVNQLPRSPDSARGSQPPNPLLLDNQRKSHTMSDQNSREIIIPAPGASNSA